VDRPASRTALFVAAYRARASARPGAVCQDPWAAALAGEEGAALAQALDAYQPHMELWLAVRTAWIDRRVAEATGPGGAGQVVVLGARLGRAGVRFFEVDHPASQEDKRRRLAAIAGYPADAATYVACDFERDDFLERLGEAGMDPGAPALFVWEGVTYYLGEAAVRATLGRLARGCHPRSTVVFDHMGKRMAEGRVRDAADHGTREMVAGIGEPLRWGTDHVLPLLYEEGFRRVRVVTFDEAGLALTGTYDRDRKWRFIHLAEASVAPDGV
jgi:methyltransferase (TIGR00027 family)